MTSVNRFEYKVFRKEWDSLLERHKYKQAEKLCHEGLAQSPLDNHRGKLYNHLGYLYENFLDDKTFDDILEHYVLSLQVDETNANSHYNLSNFLLEQGMQHLLRALELNPSHTKATKRFTNLTPIKINQTLDLGRQKFQVTELTDDGVKAVLLQLRNDGSQLYERTNVENDVYIGPSINTTVANSNNYRGMDSSSLPIALEVEDPNNRHRNVSNSSFRPSADAGCCLKCSRMWFVWALFWIIALAGVALPIGGYLLEMFQECEDTKISASSSLLSAANEMNVGLFLDCSTDTATFTGQLTAAKLYLENINIDVKYAVYQYCDQFENGSYNSIPLTNDVTLSFNISNVVTSPDTNIAKVLAPAMLGCRSMMMDNSLSSLMCVIFVSADMISDLDDFPNAINTATITAALYPKIFYSFITLDTTSDAMYSVLDTFDSISGMNNETMNGWNDVTFNNNKCGHCSSYNSFNASNAIISMASITGKAFVTGISSTFYISEKGECKAKIYYNYAIGGVIPLLIWVFIVIIVICCTNCKNNKREREIQQSIDNSGAGQEKQSAYV